MRGAAHRLLIAGLALAGAAKLAPALTDVPPAWPEAAWPEALGWAAVAAAPEGAPADPAPLCEVPEVALEAIREERADLARQREDMAARAVDLDLARETLRLEGQRLAGLRDDLAAHVARVEAAQSADVARLVALYRGMKPKEAAAIMDDLDLEVLMAVMGEMAARDAAPILARLDPGRARTISRLLLERARLPGDRSPEAAALR